jgi:hypothetical protein
MNILLINPTTFKSPPVPISLEYLPALEKDKAEIDLCFLTTYKD